MIRLREQALHWIQSGELSTRGAARLAGAQLSHQFVRRADCFPPTSGRDLATGRKWPRSAADARRPHHYAGAKVSAGLRGRPRNRLGRARARAHTGNVALGCQLAVATRRHQSSFVW